MKTEKHQQKKSTEPVQPPDLSIKHSAWKDIPGMLIAMACSILCFRFIIHAEYIHMAQQPVFFWEKHFLLSRLSIPGGLLDFLAAYLTDLLQFPWIGALTISCLILLSILLLRQVIRPGVWWIISIIPVFLLIVLHSRYHYPLVSTLSLLMALTGFLIYRRISALKPLFRLGLSLCLTVLIYLLSPGALFLFLPLSICLEFVTILHDILKKNPFDFTRSMSVIILILTGALLPLLAGSSVFLVTMKTARFHHALIRQGDKINIMGASVHMSILILFLIFSLAFIFNKHHWTRWLQGIAACIFILIAVLFGVSKENREILTVRYAAHTEQWQKVYQMMYEPSTQNPFIIIKSRITRKSLPQKINERTTRNVLCMFHINRSLYNKEFLAEQYFSLPEYFGRNGLFLDTDIGLQFPLDRSDLFFEIGHINESERWASEALTLYGESTEVLKRLALINIIQDNRSTALKYLKRLRQNPNASAWAEHYVACIEDPSKLRKEKELLKRRAMMPKDDFIVLTQHPELDLWQLIHTYPLNRMALEYSMMNSLIEKDLDYFSKHLIPYRLTVGTKLPRYYEEALITCTAVNKAPQNIVNQFEIDRSTIDQFKDFENIYLKYHGKKEDAYEALRQRYGGTFWFYMLFAKPAQSS